MANCAHGSSSNQDIQVVSKTAVCATNSWVTDQNRAVCKSAKKRLTADDIEMLPPNAPVDAPFHWTGSQLRNPVPTAELIRVFEASPRLDLSFLTDYELGLRGY